MTAPALTQYVQGVGQLGADQLNTFMQTCNTIAQLRTLVGTVGMNVSVLGTAAIGDGGGGLYYWSASSTAADNGSTVVTPSGAAIGAWLWLGYFPLHFGTPGLITINDFGGSNVASFNNATAFAAADASGDPIFIPYGSGAVYLNGSITKQSGSFPNRMWGDGVVQDSASNKLARFFSFRDAPPTTLGTQGSPLTAFNGDLTRTPFPVEHWVTGATTLGQPTSGYEQDPECSPLFGYLYNSSGFNNSTSGAGSGRTGVAFGYIKADNYGQGDAGGLTLNGFVSGAKPGATSFLANPAVFLINGGAFGGANGTYLNVMELNAVDQGFDCAAIGWVFNAKRTNNTGALNAWWAGLRFQNQGAQPVDTWISISGAARQGLDLSFGDFSSNSQAAITLKADQRIYGNVSATDASGLSRFPSALNTDYISYASSISGWIFVASNTAALQVNSLQVTATVPFKMTGNVGFFNTVPAGKPTITGAKAGNAALTSLLAGLSGLGLVNDTTT